MYIYIIFYIYYIFQYMLSSMVSNVKRIFVDLPWGCCESGRDAI